MTTTVTVPDLVAQGKTDEAKKLAVELLERARREYSRLRLAYYLRLALIPLVIILGVLIGFEIRYSIIWTLPLVIALGCIVYILVTKLLDPEKYRIDLLITLYDLTHVHVGKTACLDILLLYEIYKRLGEKELSNYLTLLAQSFGHVLKQNIKEALIYAEDAHKRYSDIVNDINENIIHRLIRGELGIEDLIKKIQEAVQIIPIVEKLWKPLEEKLIQPIMQTG